MKGNDVRTVKQVGQSKPLSQYSDAVFEAGRAMFIDSINTGRDFCKYMISVATGAIPIYLGLLKFVMPSDNAIYDRFRVFVFIPAAFFLISTIFFVAGYFPQSSRFSLEIIDEIEKARADTLRSRQSMVWIGFCIFFVGIILALIVLGFLFFST